MGFGGWEPPAPPDTVQMVIPADLVDSVGQLVSDPDGFVASVQQPLATAMVEVEPGFWVDPRRIIAAEPAPLSGTTVLLLDHGHRLRVDGAVEDVLRKLSDLASTLPSSDT